MAWNVTSMMGVDLTAIDSTIPVWSPGTIVTARNTSNGYIGEFVYMKGVTALAATSWVLLSYDDASVSLLADGDIGPVGVSMAANTSASNYSWYQIRGKASGKLAAGVSDNAGLYATATAGTAGATSAGKSEIIGARAAAASGAGGATEVEINYPKVGLSAA